MRFPRPHTCVRLHGHAPVTSKHAAGVLTGGSTPFTNPTDHTGWTQFLPPQALRVHCVRTTGATQRGCGEVPTTRAHRGIWTPSCRLPGPCPPRRICMQPCAAAHGVVRRWVGLAAAASPWSVPTPAASPVGSPSEPPRGGDGTKDSVVEDSPEAVQDSRLRPRRGSRARASRSNAATADTLLPLPTGRASPALAGRRSPTAGSMGQALPGTAQ